MSWNEIHISDNFNFIRPGSGGCLRYRRGPSEGYLLDSRRSAKYLRDVLRKGEFMLRTKDLYEKTCKRCKKVFRTDKKQAYICTACQREDKILNSKKPEKTEKAAPPFTGFSLMQMQRIIRRYNQKHGTNYSYGRFVCAIYLGQISKRDLRVVK